MECLSSFRPVVVASVLFYSLTVCILWVLEQGHVKDPGRQCNRKCEEVPKFYGAWLWLDRVLLFRQPDSKHRSACERRWSFPLGNYPEKQIISQIHLLSNTSWKGEGKISLSSNYNNQLGRIKSSDHWFWHCFRLAVGRVPTRLGESDRPEGCCQYNSPQPVSSAAHLGTTGLTPPFWKDSKNYNWLGCRDPPTPHIHTFANLKQWLYPRVRVETDFFLYWEKQLRGLWHFKLEMQTESRLRWQMGQTWNADWVKAQGDRWDTLWLHGLNLEVSACWYSDPSIPILQLWFPDSSCKVEATGQM